MFNFQITRGKTKEPEKLEQKQKTDWEKQE